MKRTFRFEKLLFCRPSDGRPLRSNKPKLVVMIDVPSDVPITEVSLPTNGNVGTFTVTVRKPNGERVPVDGGKVNTFIWYL